MKSPFSSLFRFVWVMGPLCYGAVLALAWGAAEATAPDARVALGRALAQARDGYFHAPGAAAAFAVQPVVQGAPEAGLTGALLAGGPYLTPADAAAEAAVVARRRGLPAGQVRALVAAHRAPVVGLTGTGPGGRGRPERGAAGAVPATRQETQRHTPCTKQVSQRGPVPCHFGENGLSKG